MQMPMLMKFSRALALLSTVVLIYSSVSFAESVKFIFIDNFGSSLALTLPDRKTQVFRNFKIIWNRQFRTVDIRMRDFYRDEEVFLWVKSNNSVYLGRDHHYYGYPGLFEELKARATSQTSHYSSCEKEFRL